MLVKYITFCVGLSLQYQLISTSDNCEKKATCSECISDPSLCVWCAENDFNLTRCMPQGSVDDSWCPKSLQNPQNEKELELETKDFSSVSEHVIQIKPQRYKLTLRQGMSKTFNFSFQGAKDYPVDLYLLLDASRTMENIKNMTARKAENIYDAIKKLTNNVHLGFGTFIDKRMLPFMSNSADELTYSFRHGIKLFSVDDFEQFKDKISKSPSGLSHDQQEGGLDALAQVLVCNDIIGWRNESRKIVVFLTDGPYHAAGDGKSAGLFEPYDGQCHTENNTYTKELEMDYPSVGMINKLVSERGAIVVFLVESKVKDFYDGLKRVVSGSQIATFSHSTQKMESRDDTIVSILKNIYENVSKKIKLITKVRFGSKKHFKISFEPDCTTDDNNPGCDVEIGKEQHIVGMVQYNATESAVVDIVVEGIGEKLTLEIDTIKTCDCERNPELNSAFCYGDKRVCGKCKCSENRYGEKCSCVKSDKTGHSDNTTCIGIDGSLCSGNGPCICGICQCKKGYTGKFCECNVNSCPRSRHLPDTICGGHGECDCGNCKCNDADGWSGVACDCPKWTTNCIEPKSGSVCNGRGKCECGRCECDHFAEWDARNKLTDKCVIEACNDCNDRQCAKLIKCAKCRRNELENCSSCDDRITVEVVQFLTEEHENRSLWNMCRNVNVEVGCQTSFVYRYNDANYSVELVVAKDRNCAPTYYLFGGIFLITILLVGAGTLIAWKLLTDARDRHEYLKFMQQNKLDPSGPSHNPLYEEPTTTFNNPAFRKKSVDIR